MPMQSTRSDCASPVASRYRRDRTARRSTLCLALMLLSGCYTYTPFLSERPSPGEEVALELNDQGRVGVADRLGPEVARVEGSLADVSDTTVTLRVDGVVNLAGESTKWNGESVRVRREFVRRMLEKKFDGRRTAIVAVVSAAAIGVFIATRSFLGSGADNSGKPGDGGGGGITH
ncbi:MAG: hypothetical protein M3081_15035 [Gemmatimonadota bacterium]|nr:hypothetical protein [Gemmatimonadota bacterium]